MTPSVVVADATAFVRLAVCSSLAANGIDVVAEVASAIEAIEAVAEHSVEVVLLDSDLDPGMQAVSAIRAADRAVAVVLLSPDYSETLAMAAVHAGACGVIPKDTPADRLPAIVRGVIAGEAALPRRVVRLLLDELFEVVQRRARCTAHGLSAREQEVMALMCEGFSDPEISARLCISATTVRRHVGAAMQKLDVTDRPGAREKYREVALGAALAA